MEKQRTIKKDAYLEGKGLYTGNKISLRFKPAPENTGIFFIRTDLEKKPSIKADLDSVILSSLSLRHTSIGNEEVKVHTVEHLMAVLYALGIDNLYIEINGDELPIGDGSGTIFYEVFSKAGIEEQSQNKQYCLIKEPIVVEEQKAKLLVFPSQDFKISYILDYNHPQIKTQFLELEFNRDNFEKEILPARTFCLEEEVDSLLKMGLGKGADYSNTLVIGKTGVINNKLRFDDEFVRHKILDLIGDISLLGMQIKGHFLGLRSGHSLNIKLLQKIKTQKDRYGLAGVVAKDISFKDTQLDQEEIKKILPHREPFLFVDKILKLEKGKYALGVKYLSEEDYFFKGHFPGRPIMPGVLIIEAMAQVGGVMMLSLPENRGKLAYFLACNNVKFRKTVLPGDELVLEVETTKLKSKTGAVKACAYVEGKLVAEAELMFALVEG
ncbi:MAG: bifunctional UDP-3-O-[3-hydroxymyristoyl] N-acetylglucosamine deacetylase/3-hydroxyacyl-ACP dehydratase [Candidatus Omnitrophica bacterium]|nr:bifunctional UDP-3-O-[3-hydroxymyristoyl] N-acetylglucosamine deacetylase/3-hydroxyacyl-ACP dehydratase [Candidatus Omnitrophota bacterium]MCM8799778.1 bifunctional UDP-3-O-[3-hydroxymyristoyl] N-acetylglucosamine deacetylase/3-hydroxyacyl-ACP dehydratase [Candidatus Omnitrophota bacterium]